jgi:outer membrane protein OmpA-like peptidoglycan-associated protein
MQLRGALLAASLLAVPIVASAQPVTGLYMGAGVGVNLMQDEDISGSFPPSGTFGGLGIGGKLDPSLGPAGQLSLGWGFGNGLRVEVEGDYMANKFQSASSGGTTFAAAGGWEQKFGGMVNVLYDFVGIGPIEPYVGAGVGYQWAFEKNVDVYGGGNNIDLSTDSKGSFAYQGILGVALPIAAAPGFAVTAEYRFMGLAGNRTYDGVASDSTGSGAGGATLNHDYNNIFLVGFRYNFGQAPMVAAAAPAAAPAPAVQPARSYLVFFDWDKATLTDRARQIIKEAADNSTHVQYTRIEVNGYTDTSGTPQYNMGLSIRRASAVKAELVRDGVPVGAISTQGFGETHLLVPTGPGVREPQNRRVEIIIH